MRRGRSGSSRARPRAAPCRSRRRARASGCPTLGEVPIRWPPCTSSRIRVSRRRGSRRSTSRPWRGSAPRARAARRRRCCWRAAPGRRARWRRDRADSVPGRLGPDHQLALLERAEQPEGGGLAEAELARQLRERPFGAGIRECAHDAEGAGHRLRRRVSSLRLYSWNGVSRLCQCSDWRGRCQAAAMEACTREALDDGLSPRCELGGNWTVSRPPSRSGHLCAVHSRVLPPPPRSSPSPSSCTPARIHPSRRSRISRSRCGNALVAHHRRQWERQRHGDLQPLHGINCTITNGAAAGDRVYGAIRSGQRS